MLEILCPTGVPCYNTMGLDREGFHSLWWLSCFPGVLPEGLAPSGTLSCSGEEDG